jgi:hypothetical protein
VNVVALSLIDHVQDQNRGNVEIKDLQTKIEASFQDVGVGNQDDQIRAEGAIFLLL